MNEQNAPKVNTNTESSDHDVPPPELAVVRKSTSKNIAERRI
jgi:hypothetical protein